MDATAAARPPRAGIGPWARAALLASACAGLLPPRVVRAQDGPAPPPTRSGLASTVALPPRVRPFLGPYFGVLGGGTAVELGGGLYRDVLNPSLGLLGVQAEGYLGAASHESGPRGSVAMGIRSPTFRLGLGVDVQLPGGEAGPFLSIMHPVRRGGLLIPGTLLHASWIFAGGGRLRLGFAVPIGQPLVGEDRPGSDRVHLSQRSPPRPLAPASSPLEDAATELRYWVLRVNEVVVPYLGHAGSVRPADDARVADSLAELARLLAPAGARSAVQVIDYYHASLERAFSLALDPGARGTTPPGLTLADSVRALLLSTVLLPYDRLLGQKRDPETLAPFSVAALAAFQARAPALAPGAGGARAAWLLGRLLAAMDQVVAIQRSRWGDARLIWLPLQLGLRADQHRTQSQIDALIERATRGQFSDSNEVAYVHTEQFQWELYRSIHKARRYHVLWVHNFSGVNQAGLPDAVAFRQTAFGYLAALIERVRAYDASGLLPQYHMFLDQYYFETEDSRLWLGMLSDPLDHSVTLHGAPAWWKTTVDSLRTELARAVAGSRRLQAEARARGRGWLREQICVHVHITNQADPSFWSMDILPLVGLTDDALRDHRKLVFYDLFPGDPYRGMLIVTGMGVGEEFASPEWDDRAALLRGPAALAATRAAAEMLRRQGVKPDQLPFFLQPFWDTVPPAARAPRPSRYLVPARAMQLHNQVGYGDKPIDVAKAMLYTLLPPGAVSKVPDSLWNNPLWAALLLGEALRGGRVLIMAPSVRNAPAPGARQMSLAEEIFSRLLMARHTLAPAIHAAGGLLRLGIYDLAIPVDDLPAQIDTALANRARYPWLQKLEPFSPAVVDSLRAVAAELRASGFPPTSTTPVGANNPGHPKLHLKAQFFASAEAWDNLFRDSAWGHLLAEYFRGRARQIRGRVRFTDFYRVTPPAASRAATGGPFTHQARRQNAHPIYYLLMGSHNEDYRSALLDGEDILLLAHFGAAVGIEDFLLLPSLCTWVDTEEQLHRYLPRQSQLVRWLAQWTRIMY